MSPISTVTLCTLNGILVILRKCRPGVSVRVKAIILSLVKELAAFMVNLIISHQLLLLLVCVI